MIDEVRCMVKGKKKHINIDVSYDDELKKACQEAKWHKDIACKVGKGGCGGFAYLLGIIGSAVYFISNTAGFWNGVLGFLKALVWPAFLVYGLLKYLGM
jgi:hypothetical protein